MSLDVLSIREEFPLFQSSDLPQAPRYVYLDSAATTLKPRSVIEAQSHFYKCYTANVHRGAHYLSDKSTQLYEGAREKVSQFIGASSSSEIIFTRGTTESINLVAFSYVRKFLKSGDEIILSQMEHHSNIVPWRMVADEKGLKIKVIPLKEDGELDFEAYKGLLSEKTKFVSLVFGSNSLGTINPVKKYIQKAHEYSAKVLIDAAQVVSHINLNVQDLDCDFLAFSGHKVFAPYGIGVLFGKKDLLEQMPPYQGGGSMIERVTFEKVTYDHPPQKFEAGTPNVGGAVVLAEALKFVEKIGQKNIHEHEKALYEKALKCLQEDSQVRIYGHSSSTTNILSFLLKGVHPSDVGQLLDQQGVAVRTGHHCCQPVMDFYRIPGTVRLSFSVYNDEEDVDYFLEAFSKVKEILSV